MPEDASPPEPEPQENADWLRKAGPFESQVIEAKIEEASDFFDDWLEALQTNEDLEERLEQRDTAIHNLLIEREALIEALHERGDP